MLTPRVASMRNTSYDLSLNSFKGKEEDSSSTKPQGIQFMQAGCLEAKADLVLAALPLPMQNIRSKVFELTAESSAADKDQHQLRCQHACDWGPAEWSS